VATGVEAAFRPASGLLQLFRGFSPGEASETSPTLWDDRAQPSASAESKRHGNAEAGLSARAWSPAPFDYAQGRLRVLGHVENRSEPRRGGRGHLSAVPTALVSACGRPARGHHGCDNVFGRRPRGEASEHNPHSAIGQNRAPRSPDNSQLATGNPNSLRLRHVPISLKSEVESCDCSFLGTWDRG